MNKIEQIEIDIVKAEKKFKDLQNEVSALSMDIHILQLNLNTLKLE